MGKNINHWVIYGRRIFHQHGWLSLFLKGVLAFGLFFLLCWQRLDPDYGWHLITGKYILHHGIPRHDIYTYTAKGHPWVDHEWLTEVFMAVFYKAGGYLADTIFFALIWTTALLVLGYRAKLWVYTLAAVAMLPYMGDRPVAISVLLFAVCIRWFKNKDNRYLWAIPLLFLGWGNMHAGFITGLALIAYYAVIRRSTKWALLLLLSLGATLINPYGIGVYVEIARNVLNPAVHKDIVEWHALMVFKQTWPYLAVWAAGFVVYARLNLRRWIEPGPILLAASLSSTRNFPFFIAATVGAGNHIDKLRKLVPKATQTLSKINYTLSILMIATVTVYLTVVNYSFAPHFNSYPIKAVAYLKVHPCQGHIFNDYNYGGYLIWRLPGVPVYIDGRMVSWNNHMQRYEDLVHNPSTYRQQFSQYNIKCAILSENDMTAGLITILEKNGWSQVAANDSSVLLTH